MCPLLRGVSALAAMSLALSMVDLTPAVARSGPTGGHGGSHGVHSHAGGGRGSHGAHQSASGGMHQSGARRVGGAVFGAGRAFGVYPAGYNGYDQYGCPPGTGYSIFLGRCGDMSEFFTQLQGK